MMKLRKLKMLMIINIISILLTFCKVTPSTAVTYECNNMILTSKIDVVPDNKGNFFIASYDSNTDKSIIVYFDTAGDTPMLKNLYDPYTKQPFEFNYKYTTVNYNNNSIYISHPGKNDNDTLIEKYNVLSNNNYTLASTLTLPGIRSNVLQNIAVGNNDMIFIIETNDSQCITTYTTDDGLMDYKLTYQNEKFVSITTDISRENIYALTNSNKILKYNISSNDFCFSGSISDDNLQALSTNYKFLNDTTFISSSGTIYTIDNTDFKLISCANIQLENYPSCIAIAGFDNSLVLAKTSETVLHCFNCSNGTATGKLDLCKKIIAIAVSKDKTIAITENNENKNIVIISKNDIEDITPPPIHSDPDQNFSTTPDIDDNPTHITDDSNIFDIEDNPTLDTDKKPDINHNPTPDTDDNNPAPDDNKNNAITSSIHYIDYENHIISEIPIGTTLAEFKNNLDYDGYSLSFTDANGKRKSGNSAKVGTGYTVTFLKDGVKSCSFTLIVEGDLTGTGTITSRDITCMTNYLLGKSSLEGIYLKAADINKDGEANSIDLLLMYKMLQK